MSAPPELQSPLRVALLGLGHVGRETARGLVERSGDLEAHSGGRGLRLVAVGVRDPGRDRGVALPAHVRRTDDLAALVRDRDTDVVVELLGGLEPAGELVVTALDAGKAVVTANKALLARHGAALEAHARRTGSVLRFEAAVGGGIPVLGPLAGDLAANRWSSLHGIVNGTANFILTAMADEGSDYADALARAQAAGLAEADPSADVEARDAADKLAILVRLAFGAWPDVAAIRRSPPELDGDGAPGITAVTARLIEVARREGLAIRLVAQARRERSTGSERPAGRESLSAPEGSSRRDIPGRISASVLPCAVPADSPLGQTVGVENRIELQGEPVGRVAFSGPGAGGPATSSAVLGDLLAIARGEGSTWAGLPLAGDLPSTELDDGMGGPRRWLTVDLPGEGGFTSRVTLAALRRQPAASGFRATLFPVLDELA